ncbi:MAG: hypothetical protein PHX62_03950, partial [Bacilli bacterium]|nr:hypothetical protein [Bacilli bacterium]
DYSNFTELNEQGLIIKAKKTEINASINPTTILLRQEEYDFEFFSTLDLRHSSGQAGVVILNGSYNYVSLLINEDHEIIIKKQCYDLVQNESYPLDRKDKITLFIKGDKEHYYFGFLDEHGKNTLSQIRSDILATEVSASPFTGVMFGNYALGNAAKAVYLDSLVINQEDSYEV